MKNLVAVVSVCFLSINAIVWVSSPQVQANTLEEEMRAEIQHDKESSDAPRVLTRCLQSKDKPHVQTFLLLAQVIDDDTQLVAALRSAHYLNRYYVDMGVPWSAAVKIIRGTVYFSTKIDGGRW